MTEFVAELRHYCRNPKCRSKLPNPIANPKEAFCARGCHSSFYRRHCLVCECPIEQPKRGSRQLCKKSKCRNVFQGGFDGGRYHGSPSAKLISKTPDFIESKRAPKFDPPYRLVAGRLTPIQHHCATIADGPDRTAPFPPKWEGGECERIEKRNSKLLSAAHL
jgi:hypothetical protein